MISTREFNHGYTNFTIKEILKPRFGFVHENGFGHESTYNLDLNDVYASCDERQDSDCESFMNQECTCLTGCNPLVDLTTYIQTNMNSKHSDDFLDENKRVNFFEILPVKFRQQHDEDLSSDSEVALDLRIQRKKTPPQTIGDLPAWVYCTRYSDRPSAGPRVRKRKVGICQRRTRTAFNDFQLQQLNIEFECEPYLSERRRQQLAEQLNLNEAKVKIWFQNRRAKLKKTRVPRILTFELQALGLYNHRLKGNNG